MTTDGKLSGEPSSSRVQAGRLVAGVFSALVCAVVALTWPTWVGLAQVWSHQFGYSHGYLVAPLAAWLAWRALGNALDRPVVPAVAMLPAVTAIGFLWFFFRLASIRTLEEVAAVVLLWATTTSALGWPIGRTLLFPIGYLLSAVPVWEAFVPLLQPLTSAAAAMICQFLGIPTYLDGNVVHIPNGVFAIEEGCAGSHYLVAAIALAALYGHLEYKRLRSSVSLVALAAVLAIVCNWLRVVIVIRAGHVTGMQHPWVRDHNMVGWALFTAALFPLFAAARRLERKRERELPDERPVGASPSRASSRRMALVSALAVALIASPRLVTRIFASSPASTVALASTGPPGQIGWLGPMAPDVDWTPSFPFADARVRVAYEGDQTRITLFRAAYAEQRDGREVISYDNRIEGREEWSPIEDFAMGAQQLDSWRRVLLAGPEGRRRVVLYRYTVGGRQAASRSVAKVWQGLRGLAGDRSASILAVSAACSGSCEQTDAALARFVQEMNLSLPVQSDPSSVGHGLRY